MAHRDNYILVYTYVNDKYANSSTYRYELAYSSPDYHITLFWGKNMLRPKACLQTREGAPM